MQKILLSSVTLSLIFLTQVGCKTKDVLNAANRTMDVVDTVQGTSGSPSGIPSRNEPRSNYTTQSESFYITEAKRLSRDYGRIVATTEPNPKGMTKIRIVGKHMDSGAFIDADVYFYEINSQGWLHEKAVTTHNNGSANANSGSYYLKGDSDDGDFHVAGEVAVIRGVTNVFTLYME